MASIDSRFDDLSKQITAQSAQIKLLSGQIDEMKQHMVTREEYNAAHGPLIALVNKHEKLYMRGRGALIWIGLCTLAASILSPHWSSFVKALDSFLK